MQKTLLSALLVTAMAIATAGTIATADSTSIDFESYSLGNINGQNGWSKTGGYDVEVETNTYGYALFGGQTLRISNAVTSGSFGDQTFSPSLTEEAGEADAISEGMSGGTRQPYFEAQFDFASTMATQQPGLFISVSPDRGDGARMSYLSFDDRIGGIDVVFYDVTSVTDPAVFAPHLVAAGLSRTETHTAKLAIQFIDGPSNDIVDVYIDGVLVYTGTTWENYYRFDDESNPDLSVESRPVDSLLFRASGTAAPATSGAGYLIDNVMLLSGDIPGDDEGPITSSVSVSGSTLTANVDDTTTGGSSIESAEYSLNGGLWTSMDAQDGAYDEVSEDVTADLGALGGGNYNVCVRGTDVEENVGDEECIMFDVVGSVTAVNGGGFFNDASGKKKAWTFGMDIQISGDLVATGHINLVKHLTKEACDYTEISDLVVVGNVATFTATGTCGTIHAMVTDAGEPGTGDKIEVTEKFAEDTIDGGNLQVNDEVPTSTYTLYADGSIACPGADDLSDPDGSVTLTPTATGVDYEINLVGAEPNRMYTVAISLEPNCAAANFPGTFNTDANGDGTFSGSYVLSSGTHTILVNMGTDAAGLSDPKHREISTTEAVVTVP